MRSNPTLPEGLVAPLLSADAVLLGGSVRRAVRNYGGGDPEERPNGQIPLEAVGAMARGLWRERTLPAECFVRSVDRPRFVAGTTGRSGTTWLMDLLRQGLGDTHVLVREVGLFDLVQFRGAPYEYFQYANLPSRHVYRRYFRSFVLERAYFIRRRLDGTLLGLCDVVPRRAVRMALDRLDTRLEQARTLEEIERCFGDFYLWVFTAHAELMAPGRAWISKEPPYGRHVDMLLRMVPAGRVVILVRDGRDVALSMHAAGWHATTRHAIDRWRHFTEMTRAALTRSPADHVLVVRYADLVLDFEARIDAICDFLGVPRLDLASMDEGARPRRDSLGRWVHEMSPDDREYFAATCGSLMDSFGLPLDGEA